jgi:hypothetical protein
MQRILICIGLITLSSTAFTRDLSERCWQARHAVERLNISKMEDIRNKNNQTEAQKRALELGEETRRVSNLLIQATANPTEQIRQSTCQQASRALDVGVGARFLQGFQELAVEFNAFNQSLNEIRDALECEALWSSDDACSMFVERDFLTKFIAYNGVSYTADVHFQKRRGTYQARGGVSGEFGHLRCKDGGLTFAGQWNASGSSGWFKFYIINNATGEFKGSWGDFRNGQEKFYQGTWNGTYRYR